MSKRGTPPGTRTCSTGRSIASTADYSAARRGFFLAESLGDVRVKCAQRGRLRPFRAARAALRVPSHHVEMRPRSAGLDELLQVEGGGNRTGMRRFRDVV